MRKNIVILTTFFLHSFAIHSQKLFVGINMIATDNRMKEDILFSLMNDNRNNLFYRNYFVLQYGLPMLYEINENHKVSFEYQFTRLFSEVYTMASSGYTAGNPLAKRPFVVEKDGASYVFSDHHAFDHYINSFNFNYHRLIAGDAASDLNLTFNTGIRLSYNYFPYNREITRNYDDFSTTFPVYALEIVPKNAFNIGLNAGLALNWVLSKTAVLNMTYTYTRNAFDMFELKPDFIAFPGVDWVANRTTVKGHQSHYTFGVMFRLKDFKKQEKLTGELDEKRPTVSAKKDQKNNFFNISLIGTKYTTENRKFQSLSYEHYFRKYGISAGIELITKTSDTYFFESGSSRFYMFTGSYNWNRLFNFSDNIMMYTGASIGSLPRYLNLPFSQYRTRWDSELFMGFRYFPLKRVGVNVQLNTGKVWNRINYGVTLRF